MLLVIHMVAKNMTWADFRTSMIQTVQPPLWGYKTTRFKGDLECDGNSS